MSLAQTLRQAMRMLLRDWRAGELRLFVLALVIAVGAVTAVAFFTDRVAGGIGRQSAELLGADLVLVSPNPVDPAWLEQADRRGLAHSAATEFSSVVVKADKLQLASVRAVNPGFPLRGTLRTATALYAEDAPTRDVPAPGTAWVEARVMHALALAIGERVQIGAAEFTVTRVLTYEPGSGGNFFALAPRVLIHHDDIDRTQIIQPGSRINYLHGFAGGAAQVHAFQAWLKPELVSSQKLLDVNEGNASVARAIERVQRFMGLASLLAVLMAGVAIGMAARRYSTRHFDMSAMLRCLGATHGDILRLYLPGLLVLGLIASLAGVVLGWLAQAIIELLLRDLFPTSLPPAGWAPVGFGVLTGLIILAGFAVVPVLRLGKVPPLRVLRRELIPLPASAWLVYGSAALSILALMWQHTGDWTLTFSVFAGAALAAGLLTLVAYALLRLAGQAPGHGGSHWRLGFNKLRRNTRTSIGQILAFGFTLMAMALIALVRTDLLSTWQQQLPADTPNHFVFNILPGDVEAMRGFFDRHHIRSQALYPMVRGRLTAINDKPVTRTVSKEDTGNEALQRELNLSWAAAIPPDNAIVAGSWWQPGQTASVSVEERLAVKLGIQLEDVLDFSIGGATHKARVASLRSVQWDSFHPNFYMIFPPGTLDAFPATWLTSFYLTPEQKPLLTDMLRAFPTVTVLETDQVLSRMRLVLEQVTSTVEFVLLFVLAAGFAILFAALSTSLDERLHEGALMRALGASRRQLRAGHLAEFMSLGALAGLLAAIGTEIIAYALYTRVLDLEYAWKWPVWLISPLAGALLIGAAGYFGTRRVVTRSPLTVLREQ